MWEGAIGPEGLNLARRMIERGLCSFIISLHPFSPLNMS